MEVEPSATRTLLVPPVSNAWCCWQGCEYGNTPFHSHSLLYDHVMQTHIPSRSRYPSLSPNSIIKINCMNGYNDISCSGKKCLWLKGVPDADVCGGLVRNDAHLPDHVIKHFPAWFRPLKCREVFAAVFSIPLILSTNMDIVYL